MITKDLGMVTAYAYAVSKGYTGTETEFAELMASYASVAQEAVDAALAAAQSAQAAESAKDTAQTTVDGAIAGIQAEGQTQVGVVQAEGQTQVGNVNTAGSTQVSAVQAKGTEVLNSIPADYTALSDDVTDLKSAMNNITNIAESPTLSWTSEKLIKQNGAIGGAGNSFAVSNKIYVSNAKKAIFEGMAYFEGIDNVSIGCYRADDTKVETYQVIGEYELTIPSGTNYMMISHYDSASSHSGVSVELIYFQGIVDIETEIDSIVEEVGEIKNEITNLTKIEDEPTLTWTSNKMIGASGIISNAGSSFAISNNIPVSIATTAIFEGLSYFDGGGVDNVSIACYKADGTKVGTYAVNGDYALDIQAETNYIIIGHYITESAPTSGVSVKLIYFEKITEIEDEIDALPVVTKDRNKQYLNLFEGLTSADITPERYMTNGVIGSSANDNWTTINKYLQIKAGATYGIVREYVPGQNWVNCAVAWYQSDKTFIRQDLQTTNTGYEAPNNAAYCRISMASLKQSSTGGTDDFHDVYMCECASGLKVRTINPQFVVTSGNPLTTLFGKEWALFGDSMTEIGLRSTVCYHDYIRAECGINTTNYAKGGAGYKCSDDLNAAIYQKIYQARDSLADFDVITIMAGVNDCTYFGEPEKMGSIDDEFVGNDYTIETENTVFACVNKAFELIYEYAPLAKVGVILPLPAVTHLGQNTYTFNPADNTNRMSIFVENMITLLRKKGIPYIDLFHSSALRPWDDTVNNAFFRCNSVGSPDRLHPNQYGHKFFYPLVREFMKTLI